VGVRLHGAALLAVVAGALGCGADPCLLANDEISVVARVLDSGTLIRAEADLEAGDRTMLASSLELCEGDVLRAAGRNLRRIERGDRTIYGIDIEAPDSGEVRFELDREVDDEVQFTVPLPAAFDIVAPASGAEVSRAQELTIEWTPADTTPEAMMRIELSEDIGMGVCISTSEGEHHYKNVGGIEVADDGNWLVPGGVVASEGDETCTAYYRLSRIGHGEYPAQLLPGGFVESRTERRLAFVSVP
jgi:hypothetical protein